jgi:hypothetical protein
MSPVRSTAFIAAIVSGWMIVMKPCGQRQP